MICECVSLINVLIVGKAKGHAFVYFHSQEDADKAVTILNGQKLRGNVLTVQLDKRKKAMVKKEARQHTKQRYEYCMHLSNFGLPEQNTAIINLCNDILNVQGAAIDKEGIPQVSMHRHYSTGKL